MKRSGSLGAALAFTCMLGCGQKAPGTEAGDMAGTDPGPGADLSDPSPDLTGPAGQELNLTGVWASRIVNAQIFDSMLLGKDTVFVTTLARVEVTQSGLMVTGKNKVCDVSLTPFKNNQTTYPAAALNAIPEDVVTSTLSANVVGAKYSVPKRVQLIGWRTNANPETDALPTDPKDARVQDADGDGKPGVTLEIKGLVTGKVYVVNRSIIENSGIVNSADRIAGPNKTAQVQVVLDADPALLKSPVKTEQDPDASKSTFLLVRIKGAQNDCAYIKANAGTLFK